MIAFRLLNTALGRPSVARAYAWSLALHVSAAAATCCWWPSPIQRMTLAGSRQVVQIEAAFAAERSPHWEEFVVPVERDRARTRPADDALEHTVTEAVPPVQVEPLPVAKSPTSAAVTHAPVVSETEFAAAMEYVVRSDARRADDTSDQPAKLSAAETLAGLPRRTIEVLTPQTSIAAEQVAGVQDKTSPDFSGNRPPAYPAAAITRRLEGTVLLRLHVAATGRVQRVEVVASSGHDVLDRVAVEAVSAWHGRPAHRNGTPLASIELLPIRFRL